MKRWPAEPKVAYREVDVTLVPEAREVRRGLAQGYLSAPTLLFEDGRALVEPSRDELLQALRELPH